MFVLSSNRGVFVYAHVSITPNTAKSVRLPSARSVTMYQLSLIVLRTKEHWLTQLIQFLWIRDSDGAGTWKGQIWTPGEKKEWQAHVFLGKMETCCHKDLGKNNYPQMRTSLFQRKGEQSFLNVTVLLPFFFCLLHSERSQNLNLHSFLLLWNHLSFYTLQPTSPNSYPWPLPTNTNSPHPHIYTQPPTPATRKTTLSPA